MRKFESEKKALSKKSSYKDKTFYSRLEKIEPFISLTKGICKILLSNLQ